MAKQRKKIKEPWPWSWTWLKAFERVSLPVDDGHWASLLRVPRKILRVLCGYCEHQSECSSKEVRWNHSQTITAILPGSQVELSASTYCSARSAE